MRRRTNRDSGLVPCRCQSGCSHTSWRDLPWGLLTGLSVCLPARILLKSQQAGRGSRRTARRRHSVATMSRPGIKTGHDTVSGFAGCPMAACSPDPSPVAGEDTSDDGEGDTATKVVLTDEEWRQLLTPEQYRVTRMKGTEPPFTGAYYDFHEEGVYHCVCCGNALFGSDHLRAGLILGTGLPVREPGRGGTNPRWVRRRDNLLPHLPRDRRPLGDRAD